MPNPADTTGDHDHRRPRLPQTETTPTASGPTWDAGVHALWQRLRDDPGGRPFFFPARRTNR